MTAQTLSGLLSTLTESLKSAIPSLPEQSAVQPPADGISLLDTKNELLLSYLQNLVFLIILKVRSLRSSNDDALEPEVTSDGNEDGNVRAEIVKRLVELRVYLEKGVRPLEGRLRYQIDKVVRAAEDDAAKLAANAADKLQVPNRKVGRKGLNTPNGRASKHRPGTDSDGSDGSSTSDDGERIYLTPAIDPLAYRPNPSALTLPARSTAHTSTSRSENVYRPPRIKPTALPTTTSRSASSAKRPSKSATLDEFVAAEFSTAPMVEPSIGSTIMGGGRRSKSAKEREAEREITGYEESNYVRLPKETAGKKKGRGGRERQEYGGEEWRGLGEGAERVVGLTRKGSGGGGVLERSRKRAREEGGGEGGEVRMGEKFEKRRKGLEKRRGGRRRG